MRPFAVNTASTCFGFMTVMMMITLAYTVVRCMFDVTVGRSYAVTRLKNSNLLLVLVDSADKCTSECDDSTRLPFSPVENILSALAYALLACWYIYASFSRRFYICRGLLYCHIVSGRSRIRCALLSCAIVKHKKRFYQRSAAYARMTH